jgi:hypothetical protein
MTVSDSKIKAGVAIATIGAGVLSAAAVSVVHYHTYTMRIGLLAWTVWPYPVLWFLATWTKRRSTRLYWSVYALFSLLFASGYYALPLFDRGWSASQSAVMVLTPVYLLFIGFMGFAAFAMVRWLVSTLRHQRVDPEQRP